MQQTDLYWLAGLLEGEGYFQAQTSKIRAAITVSMTDKDVVERVAMLFGTSCCTLKKREEHHKVPFKATLRGKKSIELMKLLLPLMGERRKDKILVCIKSFKIKQKGILTEKEIIEIKSRGRSGEKAKIIALDYGVTFWRIYQIVRDSSIS